MKNQKGFSLIELLIVVVIIGIIAAIAIPNLLASRRSANEGSALASMRSYVGAQATYQTTVGAGNFAGVPFVTNGFTVLKDAGLIDSSLGSGIKSGYTFAAHSVAKSSSGAACHLAQAYPITTTGVAQTGTRAFVIATEGVIFSAPGTASTGYAGSTGADLCTPNTGNGFATYTN